MRLRQTELCSLYEILEITHFISSIHPTGCFLGTGNDIFIWLSPVATVDSSLYGDIEQDIDYVWTTVPSNPIVREGVPLDIETPYSTLRERLQQEYEGLNRDILTANPNPPHRIYDGSPSRHTLSYILKNCVCVCGMHESGSLLAFTEVAFYVYPPARWERANSAFPDLPVLWGEPMLLNVPGASGGLKDSTPILLYLKMALAKFNEIMNFRKFMKFERL